MARPKGPLTRLGGTKTEAWFHSFIKNNLRQATQKWGPIHECKKNARVSRGLYLCAVCDKHITASVRDDVTRKRKNNAIVDHIEPIVPVTGWVSWDDCINKMFCELDNLQLVCLACHKVKCAEEAAERKIHKDNNK